MTKHILSINTYHYPRGGSDIVFLNHNEIFKTLGWETAVMAMHHIKNTPTTWSKYFVNEFEYGNKY